MEWVKLSAVPPYYLDAALIRAGEPAEVLFCRALAHCGETENGGRIDKVLVDTLVRSRAEQRAAALVREGLWVDEGDHYRVRSWPKHQEEHDAAAERKRRDRERKRERRRAEREDTSADTVRGTSADRSRTSAECPALEGEGEGDRDKTQPPTEVVEPTRAPAKSPRGTRVPDTWPPPDQAATLAAWAREHTPAVLLVVETANWQDWHRAKGDTAKDWAASWRTWMRKAQKDAETRGPRSGPVRTSTTDQRVAQGLALAARFAEPNGHHPQAIEGPHRER